MAEQIDIASLNFDTDKLNQNILNTRKEIEGIRATLTEYRKEMRNNQKEINELEKAQAELAKQGKENSKEYQENAKQLENLNKQQEKATKTVIENESRLRNLSKEQRELNKILDLQTKSQSENTAVMESANEVLQHQWQNQNEAAEAARAMYALRKQLNPDIEEEAKLMEELSKRIDEANEYNKQYNTENEERVKGIGRYKEQILEAINATGGFGKASKGAIPGLSGLTAGAQAFSATPMVMIVGLLVQGLIKLFESFKSTQSGMDAITKITRPLNAILQTLIGIIQNLSGLLVDVFTNPRKHLEDLVNYVKDRAMTQLQGFGKLLQGIVTLDWELMKEGFSDATIVAQDLWGAAKGVADEFSNAYEAGKRLDEITKEIEKRENDFILLQQRINSAIKEQELIARDTNRSLEERENAVKEQLKLTNQLIDAESEILDLKIKQEEINQSFNDTSREETAELNRLLAEREAIEDRTTDAKRRSLGVERQIRNEVARANEEARKKVVAEILERQKLELETFKLLNEKNKESIEDEISFAREVAQRRQEILDSELENKLISQEKYNFERLKLETELAEQEAEIAVFYATQTLNEEILALEQSRAERKRLTIDDVRETADEIDRIWQEQQDVAKQQLEAGLIDRHEYNEAILDFERERNEQINELNEDWQNQVSEDWKLRRLLENEEILLNIEDRFERERELERQHYENQLSDLEERYQNGEIAEANYLKAIENLNTAHAKAMQAIDEEVYFNRLSLASSTFANLSKIAGEQSAAGKAFAIAQTTIDTYQSAVAAFKAMSGIPIVGPALGAIASAAAITSGMQSVRKITSTNPQQKYTGGYTGDGGMFTRTGNVHAGEVVFNQADVRALGGANRVEAMRPTSELFGTMPTGVPQQRNEGEQFELMANMMREAVREGSEQGTNTGMVEAGENEYVKLKATF